MSGLIIVFQDCYTCGARKAWGEKTIAGALKAGIPLRKVSFASQEGQMLSAQAIANGITRYPFITDGKTFSQNIETFTEAESQPHTAKKKPTAKRKTKKAKETTENGTISEA